MTARTDQGRDGKLIELEGDMVGVRFERRLAHPLERVWRAITEPDELAKWFPAKPRIEGERRVGAKLQFTYPRAARLPRPARSPSTTRRACLPSPGARRAGSRSSCASSSRREATGRRSSSPTSSRGPTPPRSRPAGSSAWTISRRRSPARIRAPSPEGRWVELHESYAEQFGVSPESGRQALRER